MKDPIKEAMEKPITKEEVYDEIQNMIDKTMMDLGVASSMWLDIDGDMSERMMIRGVRVGLILEYIQENLK